MTTKATRHLYLTRHGEATEDERALTDDGRRQATLLGKRLRTVPLTTIHHGPLPRAAQTAHLIAAQLDGVPTHACEPAGDYVPHTPERHELPPDSADLLLDFVHRLPPAERAEGPRLAHEAMGDVLWARPGSRRLARHLAAPRSSHAAPLRSPHAGCELPHQTPLADPA
ncbi:histidine phosphatase family protein [Streptomyces sp. NBRC 110028]|uniref:histidine phosphatase family protein n=1 Tax=Streptomyces sp. NBRC 110028 TaxID=1621260 RepID=UPI00099E3F78|nr:histidine phosphatase family protein [Streptomyces sp. NBRC 110028]